ncbi:MAG: hypothetical protein CMO80_01435 [Verrucomicrobiales bacterium]|nr:hypothetical protein [Verrucomicrobiales bacterium]|tara:strand:- start:283 stop:1026 length:744 start_codon:yes stop_codon:yes gene_type:complete
MANEESNTSSDKSAATLESFLEDEILKTQDSLRRTRVTGFILIVAVLSYMGYITTGLTEFMEPKKAAEMTTGFVNDQVSTRTDLLAEMIKSEVPRLVAGLPDHALEQIPTYRETLENTVIINLERHAKSTGEHLEATLQAFFDGHEPEIKKFLESTENEPINEVFKEDLLNAIMDYLRSGPPNGEPLTEKFDKSLLALKQAETKIDYLTVNKDLSRAEKKTRYALAVIAEAISEQLHTINLIQETKE